MTRNQTPAESFTTYADGEQLPPGWLLRHYPGQGSWTASKDGYTRLFANDREFLEERVTWEHRRETAPEPVPAASAGGTAPAPARRNWWSLLAVPAAVALFLIGGALGASATPAPAPEPVVIVQETATPAACAAAIDQIVELRLLMQQVLAAMPEANEAELAPLRDRLDALNKQMETTQTECLHPITA